MIKALPAMKTPLLLVLAVLCPLFALNAHSAEKAEASATELDHMVTLQCLGTLAEGGKIRLAVTGNGIDPMELSSSGNGASSTIRCRDIKWEDGCYRFYFTVEVHPDTTITPDGRWTGPFFFYEGMVKCKPGEPFLLTKNPAGTVYLVVSPSDEVAPASSTPSNP